MISEKQKTSKQMRKARTRTLIQIGGLVTLSGLASLCDIQEDNDLQTIDEQDKAAILLGLLITLQEQFQDKLDEQNTKTFKQKGIRKMKQNFR